MKYGGEPALREAGEVLTCRAREVTRSSDNASASSSFLSCARSPALKGNDCSEGSGEVNRDVFLNNLHRIYCRCVRPYLGFWCRAVGSQMRNLTPGVVREGLMEKKSVKIIVNKVVNQFCMSVRDIIFSGMFCQTQLLLIFFFYVQLCTFLI